MNYPYRQEPPFCIQIEPTEGCNLRCSFCGLRGIRDAANDLRFMDVKTAELIAASIASACWSPRIEFAMHGEPMLNPALCAIIKLFRHYLPRAYLLVETNGSMLVKSPASSLEMLFEAGLNTAAIDEYQGVDWAQQIRDKLGGAAAMSEATKEVQFMVGADVDYYEYPAEVDGNPHRRNHRKRLVFVAPIDLATRGTHATLNNHAGAGAPLDSSAAGKRCAKPFRELSFRWDGSVALCCNDWRGEYVIGRIGDLTVHQLWHHARMYAARRLLYRGLRTFRPCRGCNATSYRPGLLPDKMGKHELPKPNIVERRLVDEALATGPLIQPVLRPWEKE